MSKIRLSEIEYGKGALPQNWIFKDGKPDEYHSIVFLLYLIETEGRKILVDTGCSSMEGIPIYEFAGTMAALKKNGIEPEQITDVIITHAHHDHIGCVREFSNSVIYIQKEEYDAGKQYFKDGMKIQLFEEECRICKYVKVVKVGGHTPGSSVVEVQDESQKYVIAGDIFYQRKRLEMDTKMEFLNPGYAGKNRKFVERYCNGNWIILLSHDR